MAPIIQRELKIVARRKRTFRIRLLITIVAFLWCVVLALSGPSNGGGSYVFNMLTTIGFLACLIQSVRRAASCISDEKKEGTLGLLFLTDLRARDIILGKLVSVSALSTHALLAFMPVLAMTLVIVCSSSVRSAGPEPSGSLLSAPPSSSPCPSSGSTTPRSHKQRSLDSYLQSLGAVRHDAPAGPLEDEARGRGRAVALADDVERPRLARRPAR